MTNPKVASLLAPSCADRGTTKAASLTLPALPVSPYESQVLHEIHSAANKDMPAHLVALPAVSVQPPDAVQSALEIDSMILLALQAASVVPLVLAIHSTACAAPSVVSAPPCQAAVAAALGQVTAYPALPAAHRKSANHSPVLFTKCIILHWMLIISRGSIVSFIDVAQLLFMQMNSFNCFFLRRDGVCSTSYGAHHLRLQLVPVRKVSNN